MFKVCKQCHRWRAHLDGAERCIRCEPPQRGPVRRDGVDYVPSNVSPYVKQVAMRDVTKP